MANPENIEPYKWKPGQSGNPKGRPKKIIKQLAELVKKDFTLDLAMEDKFQIIEWCLEKTQAEIELIINDKDSPVFVVCIASSIKSDIEKNKASTIESIFDRIYGRPKQALEHTGKDGAELSLSAVIKASNEPE